MEMNKETKIRTVASVLAFALVCVKSLWGVDLSEIFTPEVLTTLATLIVAGVTWAISHYKNNDYTKEACEGTGLTRYLKAQKKGEIVGENFFDEAKGEDENA